ncbi:hypothetical protein, partial [Marinitoga sp. 1155]|uniref:hypothetical protein n=1 Tax=Marinitoga sp. 1155 TaxID=1428448 RepID=UPI000640EDCE
MKNKNIFIMAFILIIFTLNIFGVDFLLRFDENINSIKPYQGFTFKVTHDFKGFNFLGELNAYNDGKYKPSHGETYYKGFYFYMKNG